MTKEEQLHKLEQNLIIDIHALCIKFVEERPRVAAKEEASLVHAMIATSALLTNVLTTILLEMGFTFELAQAKSTEEALAMTVKMLSVFEGNQSYNNVDVVKGVKYKVEEVVKTMLNNSGLMELKDVEEVLKWSNPSNN